MNRKIKINPIALAIGFIVTMSIGYLIGCQSNESKSLYPQAVVLNNGAGLENIQEVTDGFLNAWNQGDASGCAKTYHKDAIFMPPGQVSVKGRDNIQKFFVEQRQNANGADMHIEEQVKEVIYFDDWAVMRGIGQITIEETGSTENKFTFKWAMLSKMNQEGKWESVWDILNDDNF